MPTSLPFPALDAVSLPPKNDPVSPDVKALLAKPKTHQEFSSAFNRISPKTDGLGKTMAAKARDLAKKNASDVSSDDEVLDAPEKEEPTKSAGGDVSVFQSLAGVTVPVPLDQQKAAASSDEGLATDGTESGTENTNAAGEGISKTGATTATAKLSAPVGSTWMRLSQKDSALISSPQEGAQDEAAQTSETGNFEKAAVQAGAENGIAGETPTDAGTSASAMTGVALSQGKIPVSPDAATPAKPGDDAALVANLGKRRSDATAFRGEKKAGDDSKGLLASEAPTTATPANSLLASLASDQGKAASKATNDLVTVAGNEGTAPQIAGENASKTTTSDLGEKFAALREDGVKVEVSGVNSSNGVQKKNLLNVGNKVVKDADQKVGTDTANQGETTMFTLRQPTEFLARSIAPVIGAHLSSDSRIENTSSQVQQSNAAKATQVVNDIHELALSLPTESRKSVELRFDFGHQERLSVKVEMRDGTVHTTFNASSRELAETVNTAWNNQPMASDSAVKLADPVFATAPVESKNFSMDSGNGKGQQERQQAAQDDGSGSRALPSFFRSGNSTTPVKSSTPVVASDRHLQAFA